MQNDSVKFWNCWLWSGRWAGSGVMFPTWLHNRNDATRSPAHRAPTVVGIADRTVVQGRLIPFDYDVLLLLLLDFGVHTPTRDELRPHCAETLCLEPLVNASRRALARKYRPRFLNLSFTTVTVFGSIYSLRRPWTSKGGNSGAAKLLQGASKLLCGGGNEGGRGRQRGGNQIWGRQFPCGTGGRVTGGGGSLYHYGGKINFEPGPPSQTQDHSDETKALSTVNIVENLGSGEIGPPSPALLRMMYYLLNLWHNNKDPRNFNTVSNFPGCQENLRAGSAPSGYLMPLGIILDWDLQRESYVASAAESG
ncbi:hypothetical protein C8F04DRAFT_1241751 [Mycena alexandri]|uniref:Uncharacterized protein n=1 Tax=Mycena alexandri TaxID=1745969 RepID=A0AAD6WTX1_9AGAR|nr:hypothetical protein C8F04DRAFT_1241751 [Mycena alexandri]